MDSQIESIVKVLKENEYRLTDGYRYYYSYDKDHHYIPENMTIEESKAFNENVILREVAIEILNKLKEN
jgi:hypothetical protein